MALVTLSTFIVAWHIPYCHRSRGTEREHQNVMEKGGIDYIVTDAMRRKTFAQRQYFGIFVILYYNSNLLISLAFAVVIYLLNKVKKNPISSRLDTHMVRSVVIISISANRPTLIPREAKKHKNSFKATQKCG